MATPKAIDLNFRADGPPGAPVLVLSHALGLSLAQWDPQVAPLSRAFRVVRYDHRGHGGSPVPAGPYTIEELGRDLIHLLDRLGLDRVSFCGLSLGGMVGMWVATNAPERIDLLVLCCTAARMPRPDDFAVRARTVREHGIEPIAQALIGRWFTRRFRVHHPDTVARIRDVLLSTPREGYAGACEAIAQMDLRKELPRIKAPTLVIGAEEDQSTPPEKSREIADGIPGAALVVIPDAAHIANVEQPEAVSNQILDHLTTRLKEVRHEPR
jgi:3-oxoadipate enol-lactonase